MNVGTRSFFPQVVHAKLLFSKLFDSRRRPLAACV